jgi:hypothetical protein
MRTIVRSRIPKYGFRFWLMKFGKKKKDGNRLIHFPANLTIYPEGAIRGCFGSAGVGDRDGASGETSSFSHCFLSDGCQNTVTQVYNLKFVTGLLEVKEVSKWLGFAFGLGRAA